MEADPNAVPHPTTTSSRRKTAVSEPFANSCAGCHGPAGAGSPQYPSLVEDDLTLEDYKSTVRGGGDGMPRFDTDYISDEQLRSDFEALRKLAGSESSNRVVDESEWTWSAERLESAYRKGLEAFREPDHNGVACANCHAPDGLDLAVIGFTDDAILRRAGLHIPARLAEDVIDFVHAQRRRFGIDRPCARQWRPLQPGGVVLPGETPEEQDEAFAKQLVDMDLLAVTGAVRTLTDAQQLFEEFEAINLRTLPIGIALPRWAEDSFNGQAHNTINDYLMGVGRVPQDPPTWYALEDAYIENPSWENLYALLRDFEAATHDTGYAKSAYEANQEATGRCAGGMADVGGFLGFTDLHKKRSVYIVQHLMRLDVMGEPSWSELPTVPLPDYGAALNPFYSLGSRFAEFNCRNTSAAFATWPDEPAEEIPASDLDQGVAEELSRQINHSWQTLGALWDSPLLMREGTVQPNQLNYWAIHGFVQNKAHLPFFYGHRLIQQMHYYEDLRDTELHPGNVGYFASEQAHPFLDGQRLHFGRSSGGAIANSHRDGSFSTRRATRCSAT